MNSNDRISVLVKECPGRPIEVTAEVIAKKIHNVVLADRQVKIRKVVTNVNISIERVQNILREKLGMGELSTITCL